MILDDPGPCLCGHALADHDGTDVDPVTGRSQRPCFYDGVCDCPVPAVAGHPVGDLPRGHANQAGGNYPAVSTVKANLLELQRDKGTYRSWARPVGVGPRNATTYAITPLGRDRLFALDAQPGIP